MATRKRVAIVFTTMKKFDFSVSDIAQILKAEVIGDGSLRIHAFNKLESAVQGELSFYASEKFAKYLESTQASCLLVSMSYDAPSVDGRAYIKVQHPHRALIQLINTINQASQNGGRVDASAHVHPTAVIASDATIEAGAVVGAHSRVEAGARLGANVCIGENVSIGAGSVLYPHVVVYDECVVGERCIIHAHAVIGSDGFGYLDNADGSYDKIPQIGNVVLEDEVEVGAGSCIDRAALGSTILRRGVKLDNMVHIAHNVEIGENTAIAAQTGISGGTKIGKRNRIAGQVGMVGYMTTADDVTIGAQSGVSKSINQAGIYSGSPAVELRQRLRQEAALRRLTLDS